MRFWDASALVPILVEEPTSEAMRGVLSGDPDIATWWATWVECSSAISRRSRASRDGKRAARSREKLEMLAGNLLDAHPLRAAGALQLAAAIRWCGGEPEGREFVALDRRLCDAAEKEGFSILPTSAG